MSTVRLDDVRSIPDMALDDSTPPIQVETWREFADQAHDTIPCLVDDLWPEAAFGFVASPPKKGKTWVGLSLALSVATGDPFLGRFTIPNPKPVLYVALEGHRSALTHRIASIARGHGHDPDQPIPNLHLAYKPRGINIADPAWAQHLIAAADTIQAELVIVDVLRAAARIKENDATEFSDLRVNLEPLLARNVSLALLHHFIKTSEISKDRTPGERMSGSGAMYGALDVAIYITGSEDNARALRLEFEARDISSPSTLGVRLEGNGTGPNGGLTYRDKAWWTTTEAPDEDDVDVPAEMIRDWLLENGPATRSQIAAAFEISEKTVARREIRLLQMNVTATRRLGKATVLQAHPEPTDETNQPLQIFQDEVRQDSQDTCPGCPVSDPNPSAHAGSNPTQDTVGHDPVSRVRETTDLQGKEPVIHTQDTLDSLRERSTRVRGALPESRNPLLDDTP